MSKKFGINRPIALVSLLLIYATSTTYFVVDVLEAGKFLPFSAASFWLLTSAISLVLVGFELDSKK